ncbi:putative oxidoreductase [Thermosporothrix hazakensis]|uniref:DoxX family protein n=2 Tax=Thermosporothrix TaxID=768650 RepID=A0A455SCP5_9CHLR|nr:DoxX family protein [Thermosporothrix hazakensis]PZW34403.1 putative oxidoreductase [Thermosporothrix hazakensis]BBH85526.1 hypothetical protein KTC_02770 [Thermosporothrix sp. COM3]GCE46047.1 hypothetical protein KTH_09160 [Thermosporothrix hazakensis]
MVLFKTETTPLTNVTTLFLRLALAAVMFPHGAQKLLGWFGGHGFEGAMLQFTQGLHIPAILAFLAIIAEFFGALGVLTGLLTRVAAFGIGSVMTTAMVLIHLKHGFFMNWSGQATGEGVEYFLLAIAISLSLVVLGGGGWSLDQLFFGRLAKTVRVPEGATSA